jgi:hemerythrin-like domain-containing protein
MEATQSLDRDHRIIETVLPALERLGRQAEGLRLRQREEAEAAVGFLRTFVDAYHHGKEEQHLFKVMEERGVPRDGGLILHLLKEHGEGRAHVRAMSEALRQLADGDAQASARFAQHAREYVTLLRHHIEDEDTNLWPLAERVLTPEDDTRLAHGYAQVERETIGDGGVNHYRERARELSQAASFA